MINLNTNLYCYNEKFNFLKKLFFSNNLPSSIIINGLDGIGKKTFLTHFLLNTQSKNFEDLNCNLSEDDMIKFKENRFTNLKLIESNEGSIGITEIRNLINYANQTSFNDKPRFVLLSNIENLNINATNAFLKILESPPKNLFLFLIKNSEFQIMDTILSRCFKLNIQFSSTLKKEILKNLLNDYNLNNFDNFKIFHENESPGNIIKKILYLRSGKIENENIINIIFYCLNSYNKTKDRISLEYAASFAKYYFYLNFNKNFTHLNKLYNSFLKKLYNVSVYNTDAGPLIYILNNISK